MKYIDADKLRKEIERRLKNTRDYMNGRGMKYKGPNYFEARGRESAYDALLNFLDTLPEQPVEETPEPYTGIYDEAYLQDKIARATKSWKGVDTDKMLAECRGYEQPEGLEEEVRKYLSERWKLGCTPITPVCLPNFTTDDLKECAEYFYKLGLISKK